AGRAHILCGGTNWKRIWPRRFRYEWLSIGTKQRYDPCQTGHLPGLFINAPTQVVPPHKHTPPFPLGPQKKPHCKLGIGGVKVEKVMGKDMLAIEREALRALSEAAFTDINHLLRPAHLKQLRMILDDPEASDNDKFIAYDFLKNANIAAGGVLPM